jgi:transposase-like protein
MIPMTTVEVKCPYCKANDVVKNGKSKKGTQRFRCLNNNCHRKYFLLDYTYNGSKPGINEQIISMTSNASGIRDISRVLSISTDKVMDTLKKRKNP